MNPHLRFDLPYLFNHFPDLLAATTVTLRLFALSAAIASVFGILLALGRLRRRGLSYYVTTAYIEVYRNTPLLLQLYFMFFALPLLGLRLSPFATGVIALAAQHSAFFAEVYRGAIQSIPQTQYEAGRAVGMTERKIMRLVILPQAVRDAIPPLGNSFVLLMLDTALVSTIGVLEITLRGYILAERGAASLEIFVGVAVIYLFFTAILGGVLRTIESRFRVLR